MMAAIGTTFRISGISYVAAYLERHVGDSFKVGAQSRLDGTNSDNSLAEF
jgi:hypothetical protein